MKEKRKKEKGKAQTYLERIRKLDVQIDGMTQEKIALEELACRVTPSLGNSGGTSGGNQDKLGSAVTRIIAKEEEIDQAVDEMIDLKRKASDLLSRLDKPEHYRVLHGKYILYKSFEAMAAEMGYTYRNICYLHGRALQAFGKVLEEYERESAGRFNEWKRQMRKQIDED